MIKHPSRKIISISLLSAGIIIFITSCKNKPSEIGEVLARSVKQEDKAEEVTIIYSEHGKVKARLFSKEFIKNDLARPPYWDMKKGLRVEFYDDSTRLESTLNASYARYYEQQGNILIRDHIIIKNRKGEKLSTEELIWNQKLKKFYTEKFVRISTPTQVMFGDGMEANEDFTWYKITNIKGVVQVKKGEETGD
jgi:LPS export ABC transporter protein LptC